MQTIATADRHCTTSLQTRGEFAVGPRWFLTGPASGEDLTSNEPRIPDLVTHTKTMGTSTTACGLNATTWTKLWGVPFEAAPLSRRCPLCTARITAGRHGAPLVRPSPPVEAAPAPEISRFTVDGGPTAASPLRPDSGARHRFPADPLG